MGGFFGGHHSGGGHRFHTHHHYFPHYWYWHNYRRAGMGYLGEKNYGIPGSFYLLVMFAVIFQILGIGIYCIFATPYKVTATVTHTEIAYDINHEKYEIYDFVYEFKGEIYTGMGDDDLKYNGEFKVNKGEQYTIYLNLLNPKSYNFEDYTKGSVAFLVICETVSITLMVFATIVAKKYYDKLREIGDANGDGKINKFDLEYVDKKNRGIEPEKSGVQFNLSVDKNDKRPRCPACKLLINTNKKYCEYCGYILK